MKFWKFFFYAIVPGNDIIMSQLEEIKPIAARICHFHTSFLKPGKNDLYYIENQNIKMRQFSVLTEGLPLTPHILLRFNQFRRFEEKEQSP